MNKLLHLLTSLLLCFSFTLHAKESKGKVLVIMSNATKLELQDNKSADVGFFLNEFAIPVQEIIDAGYEIVVATPKGTPPLMDKSSKDPQFFEHDDNKMDAAYKLSNKLLTKSKVQRLSTISDGNLDEYVGVFVPGGHAPMTDLIVDPSVGKILTYFHKNNKPTAMICHGPIASLSVMENPVAFRKKLVAGDEDAAEGFANEWLYKGYKMTILSNAEEKEAEQHKLKGKVQFYPEDALKVAGAKIKNADPMENNVIEDRELITGQNPASDNELAKTFIQAMDKNAKAP